MALSIQAGFPDIQNIRSGGNERERFSAVAQSLGEMTRRANALKAEGRIEDAIAAHRAIADIAPHNAAVLHNLAGALGDGGYFRESAATLEKAFSKGHNAPESWLVYARSKAGLGDFEDAAAAFLRVLSQRPADIHAHRELAQLRWMLSNDIREATREIDRAIAAAPGHAELAVTRARILGQCGDVQGEYDQFVKLLENAATTPELFIAATDAALAAGDYPAGLVYARRALRVLPDDPRARQAYCRALLAAGDAPEAQKWAAQLHEEYPLDQLYIALLATAYRMAGDERYHALYDYDAFVIPGELSAPAGWGSAEAYVDDLVEALDRQHKFATHPFDQSVRHGSQVPSINRIDDPALKAFPQAAAGPIRKYMQSVGSGTGPLRARNTGEFEIITAWSIRLPKAGYHLDHVHPEGWLSSASHLRLPELASADPRAGWLKFGEPGVPTTPRLEPEHFIEPRRGVLAIFPSYMWHGTIPFEGATSRLTVAVDIAPR